MSIYHTYTLCIISMLFPILYIYIYIYIYIIISKVPYLYTMLISVNNFNLITFTIDVILDNGT